MNGVLTVSRDVEEPEIEAGEISVSREPGFGGKVMIKAKSALIHRFWKDLSKETQGNGTYGSFKFKAWKIPEGMANSFSVPRMFSLLDGADTDADTHNGAGPLITFLRHVDLDKGIEVPVEVPLNAREVADSIGTAIHAFLDMHLRPMKRTYRFTFTKLD